MPRRSRDQLTAWMLRPWSALLIPVAIGVYLCHLAKAAVRLLAACLRRLTR